MISLGKTTRNNPAAYQKAPLKTLSIILRKTVRKILNGQIGAAKNLMIAELLNYLLQNKKKNKYYCNLCHYASPYFFHTANEKRILHNSICPNCSSRKRHRGLYEIYKNILNKMESPRILHFAPEPVYYKLFQSFEYITTDLELTDVDLQLNIEDIDYKSDSFDLILCNHVLEHVSNDNNALIELERILEPSGIAILTVPGNWERETTIEYDRPDSNGHFRDYGLEFLEILKKYFNKVDYIDLYKYNDVYNLPLGLTPKHDLAFLCQQD